MLLIGPKDMSKHTGTCFFKKNENKQLRQARHLSAMGGVVGGWVGGGIIKYRTVGDTNTLKRWRRHFCPEGKK